MVSRYSPEAESSDTAGGGGSTEDEEETVVSDLQHVLSAFVEANPRAWAPLVSKWSLDTLGELFFYLYRFGLVITLGELLSSSKL